MSSNSRTAVSAELGMGLIGPEHTIVPLMATLSYRCQDGTESDYMDFDAELTELLSEA